MKILTFYGGKERGPLFVIILDFVLVLNKNSNKDALNKIAFILYNKLVLKILGRGGGKGESGGLPICKTFFS